MPLARGSTKALQARTSRNIVRPYARFPVKKDTRVEERGVVERDIPKRRVPVKKPHADIYSRKKLVDSQAIEARLLRNAFAAVLSTLVAGSANAALEQSDWAMTAGNEGGGYFSFIQLDSPHSFEILKTNELSKLGVFSPAKWIAGALFVVGGSMMFESIKSGGLSEDLNRIKENLGEKFGKQHVK